MGKYFIGLSLPPSTEDKVKELSFKADSAYLTELPVHITLKAPIDLTKPQVDNLTKNLSELTQNYAHKPLRLIGWGSYRRKNFHLKVEPASWLVELRNKIIDLTSNDKLPFSPHITISDSTNHPPFEDSDWQALTELQREDFFPESLDIFENSRPTTANPRRWTSFRIFKFPKPI